MGITKRRAYYSKWHTLSEEERNSIINKYISCCDKLSSDIDLGMAKITAKYDLSIYSLTKLQELDPALKDYFADAIIERATLYFDKAYAITESIEDFWNGPTHCKSRLVNAQKERTNAVAKANLRVNFCLNACKMLAPHIYGSQTAELKKITEEISELKNSLLLEGKKKKS